ncbi:MAG TPA: hypothetical protein PLP05_03540 [Sedimentisphaerales bacterium]|nr:hypothetical protein [Sedimentisphaerales bacterium]
MKDENSIDELLNGYIDDELSQRQQTEVKRLIKHDSVIAEKLQQLKLCKTLLSAMPSEVAPYDLFEDIKNALERKTLLQETPKSFQKNQGAKHLHFRKILASAAMIALFAALGTMIYSIVGPAKSGSSSDDWKKLTKSAADTPLTKPAAPKPIAGSQHIIANIELKTDAFIATNAFIKKTIEENGFSNQTAPVNHNEAGLYYVTGSLSGVNLLLADLEHIEQRFKSINLQIASADNKNNCSVENLSFNQIHEIINQSTFDESNKIAQQIAALNCINCTKSENVLASAFKEAPQSFMIPKPVLTSADIVSRPTDNKDNDKNKVYLTIKLITAK